MCVFNLLGIVCQHQKILPTNFLDLRSIHPPLSLSILSVSVSSTKWPQLSWLLDGALWMPSEFDVWTSWVSFLPQDIIKWASPYDLGSCDLYIFSLRTEIEHKKQSIGIHRAQVGSQPYVIPNIRHPPDVWVNGLSSSSPQLSKVLYRIICFKFIKVYKILSNLWTPWKDKINRCV